MIRFSPLLPWPVLAVLGVVCVLVLAVAAWRRARGTWARALFFAAVAVVLAGPVVAHEDRRFLPDIALLLVDRTPSMGIRDRAAIAARTEAAILAEARAVPGLVLREGAIRPGDGTRLFAAATEASADIPRGRLAGIIAITDGENHDLPEAALAAPLHVLIPAAGEERDRTLRVVEAPPFGIVGQTAHVQVVVVDGGAADRGAAVTLTVATGGAAPDEIAAHVGERIDIPVPITAPGPLLLSISAAPLAGEVSDVNNHAVVRINGVRDRLHVLLVSGEPNQSERIWRRLLKADPAVDLVHFTILRLPDKDDLTPLNELALIAFPTRELFSEKIEDFDLIILDRFEDRGILPPQYLQNIADFVRRGGGLLLTAGPEFAGVGSLQDTPLGDILPAHVPPEGGVEEQAFRPTLTAIGRAHPVTADLAGGGTAGGAPSWGRWYRALAPDDTSGEVLMNGPEGHPLLVLDHKDDGRVAMLMSDQSWLWSRGEDGGGPQAELLRRVAHWLMKEPELEEERLTATVADGKLQIERRTLAPEAAASARVTAPDGSTASVALHADGPGRQAAVVAAAAPGIWRVDAGGKSAFAAASLADPLEWADLRATATRLAPVIRASGGSAHFLGDGAAVPALRMVDPGDATSGDGWIGLRRNHAHVVTGVTEWPLLPPWAALPVLLLLAALAWWREGSRI